mgnify:CR=1 FL=1
MPAITPRARGNHEGYVAGYFIESAINHYTLTNGKDKRLYDAAKKLADWASSKDAMFLYGKNFAITAQPGVAPKLKGIPDDYEQRLVKLDFAESAANRARVLAEWTQRYDGKSEKKK